MGSAVLGTTYMQVSYNYLNENRMFLFRQGKTIICTFAYILLLQLLHFERKYF